MRAAATRSLMLAALSTVACERQPPAAREESAAAPTPAAEFTPIATRGDRVSLVWIAKNGDEVAVGRDGAIVSSLYPVSGSAGASQELVARNADGVETWRRTLRSASSGMTIMGLASLGGGRVAAHVGWTVERVEWDDVTVPAVGFDVFVVGADSAAALPGAFGGSVSALASNGDDVVVAGGSVLPKSYDNATLGPPWRLVGGAACEDDGERRVVARWRGGMPTWLHCVSSTGYSALLTKLDVAADGDVVGCFSVHRDSGLHVGTLALEPEPPSQPPAEERAVIVRIDGETGALEWASQLPTRGPCGGLVALEGGEIAVAHGALVVGNDGAWRAVPNIETWNIARGLAPRGLVVIPGRSPTGLARVTEIDLEHGTSRWRFELPAGIGAGLPFSGGGTVAVVGLFHGHFDAGAAGRLESVDGTTHTMMLRPDP